MEQRQLGQSGPEVSAIGLGTMGMSPGIYGPADREESIATLQEALDRGVTLVDTGDFYSSGDNELLVGEALKGRRDQAVLSVKFGALRNPAGGWGGVDGRPEAVKNFLAYSLRRLNVDHVDIYRLARLDPNVPIEDTVGAIAEMIQAGYVRYVGLSEVGAETIRRAASVHPISDLQIEYSLVSRGIEESILPAVRELGIGITAYGVLSRGLISGHWHADARDPRDFRSMSPRFQPGNVEHNLALVERVREIAQGEGVTVAQLAIAWVLAKGGDIVPLVGARRRDRLEEALGALDLRISDQVIRDLEAAVPKGAAAGERYAAPQMAHLDSERG